MDYKFASFCAFSSFNSRRKAAKLLSALDNVKNDFKRPALSMNHISESIIRGVFSKIVRSIVTSTRPSTQVSYCHSALSQRFSRLFRLVVIYTCYLFRVVSLPKKVNGNLVGFRFYGGFCFDQFPMSLTFYLIFGCFETSDSKTLPVKCINQSDFDLLDFDID